MGLELQIPETIGTGTEERRNKQVVFQGSLARVTLWARMVDEISGSVIEEAAFTYTGAPDHPKFYEEASRDLSKDAKAWAEDVINRENVRNVTLDGLEADVLTTAVIVAKP